MLKLSPRQSSLAVALALGCCRAGAVEHAQPSLVDFSLEQLSDMLVTPVSRQETRLADAPASIYSISAADIRRAGASSLPEALRPAPNLQVARADACTWAVTARGFGSTLENKLLVLIDGFGCFDGRLAGGADLRLQAYLDHAERDQTSSGAQVLDTFDLEAQHGRRLGSRHAVVWGGGYRLSSDRIANGAVLRFNPAERKLHWGNLFAQDEISLRPALRLTLGIWGEHNSYTGYEALPNAHLAWSACGDSLWWAGASRIDRELWVMDARNSTPGAPRYSIAGGAQFESEVANVLELGYRGQLIERAVEIKLALRS